MACEITEFVKPPSAQGNLVPVYQFPPLRHGKPAAGDTLTIGAGTFLALVQPAEDVRYTLTTDGTAPGAPDSSSPIWKAGQRYDIFVQNGWKIRLAAA